MPLDDEDPYLDGQFGWFSLADENGRSLAASLERFPPDPGDKIATYAHPEKVVSIDWLLRNLGEPGLVLVESDEDVLLYETGHIPGAVKLDWHVDLNDQTRRDYLDGGQFAKLMTSRGISRDTTIVIYGDKNNWWAAYAAWVLGLFGHPDVRLLDGGRDRWIGDGHEVETGPMNAVPATKPYPVAERDDITTRIFRDEVAARLGRPLIDIRSPQEYSGEITSAPGYPEEGVLRAGHIPGALNVPWARAVAPDGTFKSTEELAGEYVDNVGLDPESDIVTYCRIGERSSHTWFVLTHLLGFENVRNYDGSWTEWGNLVRVPIATGGEPGDVA